MMYYNLNGADAAQGATEAGNAASNANAYAQIGKIIGDLTIGAVDASKRRKMDYNLSQQRLTNELGLAKTAQEQQYNLGKLGLLAQAQSGFTKGDSIKGDNKKLYMAIGVGAFTVLGVLMYTIVNRVAR